MCCSLVKLTITLLFLCISSRISALPLRQPFLEHRVAAVRCKNNRRVVDVRPNRTNQRVRVAAEKAQHHRQQRNHCHCNSDQKNNRLLNWTYAFCFVICLVSLLLYICPLIYGSQP